MKAADTPFALAAEAIPEVGQRRGPEANLRRSPQRNHHAGAAVIRSASRSSCATGYIPYCRKDPGVWAINDGDAYYAFRVRQSTTLNKTPAEIHEIGLKEVARDEAEMLAIVKKLGFADLKTFNAALKANPKLHPPQPTR